MFSILLTKVSLNFSVTDHNKVYFLTLESMRGLSHVCLGSALPLSWGPVCHYALRSSSFSRWMVHLHLHDCSRSHHLRKVLMDFLDRTHGLFSVVPLPHVSFAFLHFLPISFAFEDLKLVTEEVKNHNTHAI